MSKQPIIRGLKRRCPTCGEGRLFSRYLVFRDECEVCGQDFRSADTADGPAFFVGFLIMIFFAPFYFILPMLEMAIWLKLLLFVVLIGAMIGLYTIAPAIYDSTSRVTGVGLAIGVGRAGAICAPLIGGLMLQADMEVTHIYAIFSVPLLLAALAVRSIKLTKSLK